MQRAAEGDHFAAQGDEHGALAGATVAQPIVKDQVEVEVETALHLPAGVLPEGRGMIDLHVHFMPDPVLRKVWAYFEDSGQNYGRPWPVRYKLTEPERVAALRGFGVETFAPLAYAHKPGMAQWLNEWVAGFAAATPSAVPTATFYPEPGVAGYLRTALEAGARAVKLHVQVGGLDPRDPLLDRVWGMVSEARIPAVVHCGDGPRPGRYTGLGIFAEVLHRHPRLIAVLAHAGMPDYLGALDLVRAFPGVHLDTTLVGTAFTEAAAPLPADWPARLVDVADRIVLGSDFPNIPYPYAEQVAAIVGWAQVDDRLGTAFLRAVLHDNPARLLALTRS
jgi:predicted TIM-barrel fold metal-dependent hydrolase